MVNLLGKMAENIQDNGPKASSMALALIEMLKVSKDKESGMMEKGLIGWTEFV
jgi:hypothetical protein